MDRRTSILKANNEWANMNRTNGDPSRRVSFHNMRTVQHFDVNHGNFHMEPKDEYFSLSSISSVDELTKHSAVNNSVRAPLSELNNAAEQQKQEVRHPLGDKKKPRQSMGVDDTRVMFERGNDQGNLTLQFGARQPINETSSDDNTQALFDGQAQQTCTEAFFEKIRENEDEQMGAENPQGNPAQNVTMNNDATEDFLQIIASQGRQPEPANNSLDSDTLAGGISPKSSRPKPGVSVTPHYAHSEYGVRLDQTAPRSAVPMRDDTVQTKNNESPAINQTFGNSFQPEISSYVLHENSEEKDACKSIQGVPNLVQPNSRPIVQQESINFAEPVPPNLSFTFADSLKDLSVFTEKSVHVHQQSLHQTSVRRESMQASFNVTEQDHVPMQHEPSLQVIENQPVLVESISPDVFRDDAENTAEMSKQVTLYDEEGFELRDDAKKSSNHEPMDTLPAILTQSIFLEDSRILTNKEVDNLGERLNQTVEMADEPSFQLEPSLDIEKSVLRNQPNQTYAVGNPSPNLTYVVQTPVVKSKINSQDTITLMSGLNEESTLGDKSDSLHKKLNETRDKLGELEAKVAKRRTSASFKQILAEAKFNRSVAQSPMAISPAKNPDSGNCPPLKQARIFNNFADTPRTQVDKSFAVSTVVQQTPQPNTRKSQHHKIPNALQALSASKSKVNHESNKQNVTTASTPIRRSTATPSVLQFTPQVSAQQHHVPNSVLKAVINTPNVLAPIVDTPSDINPLHGPVQLKSVEYIKWAQQLEFDPNWLNVERVPKWNPLPDDYLDKFGPTAGTEKTDLKRKADRIVIDTINKFDGNMYKVRRYLWELAQANANQAQPYRDRMWQLKIQHDNLVDQYNSRLAYYNSLVKHVDSKKHAEMEQFIEDMKRQVKNVMVEWTSD